MFPLFTTRCLHVRHNVRDPSGGSGNCGRERCPLILPKWRLPRKSTTWDRRLYFPSEGRRAEDFFALKNPTASAGFEPANLGPKGQHATPRPPKPLTTYERETLRSLYHKRSPNTCFQRQFPAKQTSFLIDFKVHIISSPLFFYNGLIGMFSETNVGHFSYRHWQLGNDLVWSQCEIIETWGHMLSDTAQTWCVPREPRGLINALAYRRNLLFENDEFHTITYTITS